MKFRIRIRKALLSEMLLPITIAVSLPGCFSPFAGCEREFAGQDQGKISFSSDKGQTAKSRIESAESGTTNSGKNDNADGLNLESDYRGISSPGASILEEKWGVRIIGTRLTSAGYMLDFRFKVLDPGKSAPLLDPRVKAYLIDKSSGQKFFVPSTPKVGSLRQTTLEPVSGRIYCIFFANPGKFIKPGNEVSIVIGDFESTNVVLQ